MWEFASVMQYIFMFGKIVKIDEDFDIDVCPSTIIFGYLASKAPAAE